jgi:[protein-PII] uridylyltransferase
MNRWKLELLTDLYSRTRSYLTDDSPLESARERLRSQRRELREQIKDKRHAQWWDQQVGALPPAYLLGGSSERILEELDQLRRLPRDRAVAWGRYLPERHVVQYTVGAHEEITPGVFHRLTGALTSQGQQILSAEIYTLADELVLDRFCVQDMDFSGEPPAARLEEICRGLVAALEDPTEEPPAFRRLWRPQARSAENLSPLPTYVRCDNSTSERFTIFAIFAYDRMGLLHAVSRTLFEQGLSVHVAKIATYLDQVVDVFYVTDQQGRKIHDEPRISEIRSRLLEAIERQRCEDAGG